MWIDEIYLVLFLYRVEILDLYVRTLSDIIYNLYLSVYINLCIIYILIELYS